MHFIHEYSKNKVSFLKRMTGELLLSYIQPFSSDILTWLVSFFIPQYSLKLSSSLIDGFFFLDIFSLASASFVIRITFSQWWIWSVFRIRKYSYKFFNETDETRHQNGWSALNERKWHRKHCFKQNRVLSFSFSYLKRIKHLTTFSLRQLKYSTWNKDIRAM